MRAIQGGHLERGLLDVGYHFVVMPSGRIFLGRPILAMGAHVQGHNVGAVGICLAGNFDDEEPSGEAMRSLEHLLRLLTGGRRRTVPVVGHGDLSPETTCPGGYLARYLEQRAAGPVASCH
jgi:N-acetylmuramoyl-L-alanine amidase